MSNPPWDCKLWKASGLNRDTLEGFSSTLAEKLLEHGKRDHLEVEIRLGYLPTALDGFSTDLQLTSFQRLKERLKNLRDNYPDKIRLEELHTIDTVYKNKQDGTVIRETTRYPKGPFLECIKKIKLTEPIDISAEEEDAFADGTSRRKGLRISLAEEQPQQQRPTILRETGVREKKRMSFTFGEVWRVDITETRSFKSEAVRSENARKIAAGEQKADVPALEVELEMADTSFLKAAVTGQRQSDINRMARVMVENAGLLWAAAFDTIPADAQCGLTAVAKRARESDAIASAANGTDRTTAPGAGNPTSSKLKLSKMRKTLPNPPAASSAAASASAAGTFAMLSKQFGHLAGSVQRVNQQQQEGLRARVTQLVYDEHKISRKERLPGPLPATVNADTCKHLKQHDYWVCEKSDGFRYFLYFSRNGIFFVDRKFAFYRVTQGVDPQLLEALTPNNSETLFDGELVEHKDVGNLDLIKEWYFLVFDAVVVKGQRVAGERYRQRQVAFIDFIIDHALHKASASQQLPFDVKNKDIYTETNTGFFMSVIKDGTVRGEAVKYFFKDDICNLNDGLVFTPDDNDFLHKRTHLPLLKWKWPGMNTVDFHVIREMGKASLALGLPNNQEITVAETELTSDDIRLLAGAREPVIAECAYKDGRWGIKHVREDKNTPNFITVGWSTLETIVDGVTVKMLADQLRKNSDFSKLGKASKKKRG